LKQKIGRLAMRHEGKWWNAYYALPDTMKGALPLGSIAMTFVVGGPLQLQRKEQFMEFMKQCVSDILEDRLGTNLEWPDGPTSAPEHERSGND
jgi:hypothetical protein